jgi:hypothetical protein
MIDARNSQLAARAVKQPQASENASMEQRFAQFEAGKTQLPDRTVPF